MEGLYLDATKSNDLIGLWSWSDMPTKTQEPEEETLLPFKEICSVNVKQLSVSGGWTCLFGLLLTHPLAIGTVSQSKLFLKEKS